MTANSTLWLTESSLTPKTCNVECPWDPYLAQCCMYYIPPHLQTSSSVMGWDITYTQTTQLYFAFKPIPSEQQASLACIKACLGKIDSWMVQNKLKLNQDKTEFLVLNTQQRPQPVIDYIKVKTDRVEPSFSAKNIGAIFDQKISLEKHVAYICKSSFYYLRNITKIRNCLSKSDTEILIHAFIFSKLNSRNSLLYGLP